MNDFKKLVKFILPYKFIILKGVILEALSVFFAIFSYTMIIPFLRILFNPTQITTKPEKFSLTIASLQEHLFYFISFIIQQRGPIWALFTVSFIVIVASFFKNFFLYASRASFAPALNGVARDFQKALYLKIIHLPITFFSDEKKGSILSRMTSDIQIIRQSVSSTITFFLTKPIALIFFITYLIYMNYLLTIVVLISLPIIGFGITRLSRTLKTKSYNQQNLQAEILNITDETITGLRVIKAFNAEKKLISRFVEKIQHFFKLSNKVDRRVGLASPLSEFLGTIVVMGIMVFGSIIILKQHSSMSSEAFIAYLVIFSQVINPAKELVDAYYQIQKGLGSLKRIYEILDLSINEHTSPVSIEKKSFDNEIIFKDVNFSYDNKQQILSNINITIKKGQTVAIVGESGSGKSTLVDLLPRFFELKEGSITIDGIPIQNINLKDLRNLFGIVSQKDILFNDTIENNITFGVDTYTEEQLIEAIKIANAYDFIMEKPEGLKTNIGQEGSKLSGGQRQRLCIARAVLKNPPIFILDEATSSLDTESEKLVQDALDKIMKNKTSIVIAHRLSTVKNADKIYVLKDGKIVEEGTHEKLINLNGYYKKLVDLQMI